MIKRLQIALFVSLGLLLVLPGPATAQQQLAAVENFGDTLVFHPLVEFAQLVLTVTGPCDFQYRQVVTKGEPLFRLDPTTIDGAYRYDLVRVESIDPAIVEILQDARKNFDEETPRQLCRDGKLPAPPTSQSEGFQVFRGEIIYDPGAVEKSAARSALTPAKAGATAALESASGGLENMSAADFVIIDDLIVDGSACIGFDCVNGESFGFDTLRLKENNLRIKFDDTSTAASFPRNDWQITANDSANGGLSKFSIDDISGSRTPFTIEANARSHSLYVDDGGRIGSRTSTPSTEIHTVDGDTPTLRLQQDGSSGFAPQTWDVAGNETNFFVRDVTNGSTLPFRIRPGAPSSSIFIDVDGDVGLGTSSPANPLHVLDSDSATGSKDLLRLERSAASTGVSFSLINGADTRWDFDNTQGGLLNISLSGSGGAEVQLATRDLSGATNTMTVQGDIAAVDFNPTSSRELKTDIVALDGKAILQRLMQLPIAEWRFKSDVSGLERHLGPMAEDFKEVFGLSGDGKHLSLVDTNGVALAAIQGLNRLLEEKDEELEQLRQQVVDLESLVRSLAEQVEK